VRWTGTALAPPLPVLALLQLLHAATFAMQHLAAMMLLSRTVPPERAATAQALHSALGQGVPNGLMVLLTGVLYAKLGGYVYFAMAAVSGLALALVGPVRRITGQAGWRDERTERRPRFR
jgi:PPP family 3-phenylpropionic acid transporter